MTNRQCGSSFEYAVPLTRYGLLGNIAVLNPGKALEWDTTAQRFRNNEDANRLLKRSAVRKGWEAYG